MRREAGNTFDPFAVAVMRGTTVVGHVLRRISSICSLFLRKEGSITCQVTGHRQFSGEGPRLAIVDMVHVVSCVVLLWQFFLLSVWSLRKNSRQSKKTITFEVCFHYLCNAPINCMPPPPVRGYVGLRGNLIL